MPCDIGGTEADFQRTDVIPALFTAHYLDQVCSVGHLLGLPRGTVT